MLSEASWTGGVGLRLILGRASPQPGEELPLAGDRDPIRFRLREAVRGPSIIEQGPAELTYDENIGLFGHALAGFAAMLADDLERIRTPHRREPAGEGDSAFEC